MSPNGKPWGLDGQKRRLYFVWRHMRSRTSNPSDKSYYLYGGRGVRLCARWESFASFYEDMAPTYKSGLEIDRIDNDGPYSPGNCRWATSAEQKRNSRSARFIEFGGRRLCVADWAAAIGISKSALVHRFGSGWSVERALTTPHRFAPLRTESRSTAKAAKKGTTDV